MMAGFFLVTDVPQRRVVQYKRVAGHADGVVYVADESVLGDPVDAMPFASLTGVAQVEGHILFEVPYLPDAGAVYFATQPEDAAVGDTITVTAKAGKAPHTFQWYRDDKQVVNVPDSAGELVAACAGKYWVVVTDADGVQAVSRAVTVA